MQYSVAIIRIYSCYTEKVDLIKQLCNQVVLATGAGLGALSS